MGKEGTRGVQRASEVTLKARQSAPSCYEGDGLDKERTKRLVFLVEPGLQPHHHMPSATAVAANLVPQSVGIVKAANKASVFLLLCQSSRQLRTLPVCRHLINSLDLR